MDEQLKPQIYRVWEQNFRVYGAHKVWKQMNRERIRVARCTVERLMGDLGIEGVRRGKRVGTTVPDNAAACPQDLVRRHFEADRPNRLWVADFTYISTWQGWLYVAFIIDAYAKRIVGWHASSSMTTTSFWMRLSKLCTTDAQRNRMGWSITPIADRNTCPFAIPSAWVKPALIPRSATQEVHTTTRWPRRSTDCTKRK